ncbi:IS110 family transposase [Streptomyces sp. NPDC055607]
MRIWNPGEVAAGIETDRGSWTQALVASGAESDVGDVHVLADMVRIDRDQPQSVAGYSDQAQAVKVVARTHQTLIRERTRTFQRLRTMLREYFPAALNACADLTLTSTDVLEVLIKAPAPVTAAKLIRLQIAAMEVQVRTHFLAHPNAEICLSMPGIGEISGVRMLAEFGDAPYATPARRAARTTPAPVPSSGPAGKSHTVQARYVRNNRLAGALQTPGVLRPTGLTWSPPLLRQTTRSRGRLQPRALPTRQPTRRHPPWLP